MGNIRILLVEDNDQLRKELLSLLYTHFVNIDVMELNDGGSALAAVTECPPDLIITDLQLPGLGGLELTKKVKGQCENVHILVLTSSDLLEYKEKALNNGADCFLSKLTSSGEDIVKAVRSFLPALEVC